MGIWLRFQFSSMNVRWWYYEFILVFQDHRFVFRFEFWHAFLALVIGVSFGCCRLMEKLWLFHDCVSLFLVKKIRISFKQNNGFGVCEMNSELRCWIVEWDIRVCFQFPVFFAGFSSQELGSNAFLFSVFIIIIF